MSTIFEQIIAGDIPANKIYEDGQTFAFLDANPVNPGHTLVIPKEPYKNIETVPEDLLTAVMQTVKFLAPQIQTAVKADGFNIHENNGTVAGQVVPHLHFHIIPRFEGDDFEHWHGAEDYHDGKAGEEIAARISRSL